MMCALDSCCVSVALASSSDKPGGHASVGAWLHAEA